jgi:putative endopeptidase
MTLDAADRDPSAEPGVDFYRFANGGWQDANPIPAGFGAWGAFEEVHTRNELVVHELLEAAAVDPQDDLDRMLGDYFAAGMDVDAVEAAGITPIQPLLDAIREVRTHADVLALLPQVHHQGISPLFMWGVTVDHDDSTQHLLWLVPTGLGLPDRDSYVTDTEAAASLRQAYVAHVAAQLVNIGEPLEGAHDRAAAVLAFETALADRHLRAEERRDVDRVLNRHSIEDLGALAPELDLPGYLRAVGAGAAQTVNVENPAYLAALHGIVSGTDVPVLRDYLAFQVVSAVAETLPAAIDDEAFAFYGRRVEGKQEQKERHKRVISALGQDMGEAVGQRFVVETFPPEAKERALAMVEDIIGEMRLSLQTRTWMREETRIQGLEKLGALRVKIGYPDHWRDWSGLHIDRTSYAGNRLRAARFELDRQLAKLTEPVDTTEWEMPPHAVNAYYHPMRNEIVFPAGILQPPMFDAAADDAVNYGGIGTVIAHEITHGFDDQGRRFDATGAFRDWWTEEDQQHFAALTERLVTQFDAYPVIDEVRVNGRLTLGENIADLGGVSLAVRAHAKASAGSPAIDGLEPSQRFFLAMATLWRANTSDELKRTLAQVDTHSPREYRVLGPCSNLDAFQSAFGLPDDAPMMRAREERIEIW